MMTYPQYTQTRAQRAIFRLLFFAFLLIAYHSSLVTASGQSATASLSGTVEDQSGAVVAGAGVTVMNVNTRLQREATTDAQGRFTIPFLPPSAYTVTVRRDGFAPLEIKDVALNVGDQRVLQIQLKVGKIDQTITVEAASLINESPAVGTVIDRQFVGNLPLNGRSFQSLILLTPGVVVTTSNVANPGQFSVNGQRSNANNVTVDGVSANVGISISQFGRGVSQQQAGAVPGLTALGTTQSLTSVDALEEFKIQTSTFSSEFGRQPGGQVSLVTRSGTNQFRGTLFNYFRNEVLDANDWFNNSRGLRKAALRQNDFGGVLGGPILKNRSFFFFSYEGLRLRLPVSVNSFVPSLRLRQLAPPGLQPLLTMFPLPTGPETTSNAVPSGLAPVFASYSNPSSVDATSIRIDHIITNRLLLFGRYAETPSENVSRSLSFLTASHVEARTLTLGATLSLTPSLNNDFRFNYSRNRGRLNSSMDDFGGAVPIDPSVLVSGYSGPGNKQGVVFFRIPGATLINSLGDVVDSYQRQINFVDNLSWVKGAHQFKFGIDYRRLAPEYGPVAYTQQLFFFSQAQIINGTVALLSILASQGSRPLFDNFSVYAQDTWKLSPRLTLDLGLRWELNPAPHDANGLEPVLLTGINGTDVSGATLAPRGEPFYKTFYQAFAPRAGVAYVLRKAPGWETVLRGGFGVYYDLGSGQATAGFSAFPFSLSISRSNVPYPVPPALAQPPAFPPVQLPLTNIPVTALNPDLKLPYTFQWNFALEQALGANQTVSFSYVASAARRLLATQSLNNPPGFIGPSPNTNFGSISLTTNGPTSDYQSLQVQYQRRLSRGLQALVNYTLSHAIDEVSNEVDVGTLERGNADFDVRHNFSSAFTYDIPKPIAGAVLTALCRDWSVDSTMYAHSGPPVNLTAGFMFRADGSQANVRPDLVPGAPLWVEDTIAPGGRRINRAAFQSPPTGDFNLPTRQGTLGRNVVRLPLRYQVNFALRRQFDLSERWKLQFRGEAFNLFNHPLFGEYNTDIQSSAFGVPSVMLSRSLGGLNPLYQIGGPRSMQLSLKLSF